MSANKKNFLNKEWSLLIKLLIIGLSLWFIYKQVVEKEDLEDFMAIYLRLAENKANWLMLFFIDILMGINWYLEAYKWKVLVDKFEQISIYRSLRATFSGITVSFFTPNRMGEFAGRVMHISPQFRIITSLATIIGSVSQLLVTCIFGFIGLAYFLPPFFNLGSGISIIIWLLAVLLTGLLLNMFFHIGFLTRLLHHLRMLDRFENYISVFEKYTIGELIRIFLLSCFRYLVFTIQFTLLLQIMGVQLNFIFLLGLVTVVYFVLTIVPTIALTELPIRGSVAIYIIGQYSTEHLGILCASFTLWFINLVIPAILGSISVLYFRFTK